MSLLQEVKLGLERRKLTLVSIEHGFGVHDGKGEICTVTEAGNAVVVQHTRAKLLPPATTIAPMPPHEFSGATAAVNYIIALTAGDGR